MDFNFQIPTKIVFGCGRIKKLKQYIPKDIKRILIVTDKNVFEKSGAGAVVLNQLKDTHVEIFDEVEENPSFETINKGVRIARENNSQLILGIGGGSPMDAAKGIASFATNSGPMINYLEGKTLLTNPLPIICIPTTSGTGSEVTPFAVFTDHDRGKKMCLAKPEIFPSLSIIDPELTYSMPETVTINTGLDALTHAIEGYLSLQSSPISDLFALQSIEMVLDNLNKAIQIDTEAITNMAYASMMAGVSIAHSSTILLHIMAYPLTIFHGIAHGRANAILLPAFLDFMRRKPHAVEKVKTIDNFFDWHGGADNYINGLNISTKLSSYGIQEIAFENYAQETMLKDDIQITPAKITKEDIIGIYRSTY